MEILYDIHTHLLPQMDDGCKTVDDSIAVLRMAGRQGVRVMYATPHYYPVETIGDFLNRRKASTELLKTRLAQESDPNIPQICLGAEVAYRQGISTDPDLPKLCLGGSEYLLLELPFHSWGNDVMRELRNISVSSGLIPVLAHLERYVGVVSWQQIESLLELDVLVQVNGESFLHFSDRQAVKKLMRRGKLHLLGSDCHNLTTRKPCLDETSAFMQKHHMQPLLDNVNDLAAHIYSQVKEEYRVRV